MVQISSINHFAAFASKLVAFTFFKEAEIIVGSDTFFQQELAMDNTCEKETAGSRASGKGSELVIERHEGARMNCSRVTMVPHTKIRSAASVVQLL